MSKNYTVVSSPHIQGPSTTRGIMLDVVIALAPAIIASVWLFGFRAGLLIAVSVVSCIVFEALYCALLKKPSPRDLSAVVTGILLAFNVPATLPVWQMVFGALVSVIVAKQLFGGLGCNFVNPALVGRVAMTLSFPSTMTHYAFPKGTPDILSSATPLALVNNGTISGTDNILNLLLGQRGGMLGCTCIIALVLGGVYLVIRGVIKPIIPVVYFCTTLLLVWAFGDAAPLLSALGGGLVLGAVFMATDYVTSPYTDWGKVIFAVGCGIITAVIREFSNATEGVSFSILLMNLVVPYINDLTRRKPFGEAKK